MTTTPDPIPQANQTLLLRSLARGNRWATEQLLPPPDSDELLSRLLGLPDPDEPEPDPPEDPAE